MAVSFHSHMKNFQLIRVSWIKLNFDVGYGKLIFRITNKSLHKKMKLSINILTTSVPHHIETSQLICYANQLTGFYMSGTMLFSGVRVFKGVFRTLSNISDDSKKLFFYIIGNMLFNGLRVFKGVFRICQTSATILKNYFRKNAQGFANTWQGPTKAAVRRCSSK